MGGVGTFEVVACVRELAVTLGELLADADLIHYTMGASEKDEEEAIRMIPTANFANGNGTLYFAGLTNGQPRWSGAESNCIPVVQDNPTNGPAWPNDAGTVGNVSVTYPPGLGLWLMTYDAGRSADSTAQYRHLPERHV